MRIISMVLESFYLEFFGLQSQKRIIQTILAIALFRKACFQSHKRYFLPQFSSPLPKLFTQSSQQYCQQNRVWVSQYLLQFWKNLLVKHHHISVLSNFELKRVVTLKVTLKRPSNVQFQLVSYVSIRLYQIHPLVSCQSDKRNE